MSDSQLDPTDAAKVAAVKLMDAYLALSAADAAISDAIEARDGSPDPDRTSAETLFILAHIAAQMAVYRSGINDWGSRRVARDLVEEACEELGLYEEEDDTWEIG